jgi:hypothetical protein
VNDNDGKEQQNSIREAPLIFGLITLLRKFRYDGFLSLELGWAYLRSVPTHM